MIVEEILNKWFEVEVVRIFCDYGEEKRWKYLVCKIVDKRLVGGIYLMLELVKVIGGNIFGNNLLNN